MKSKKERILVVDDDVRVLRMMRRILELEGFQVLTAGSGEAAFDILAEVNLDLVLLDVMMPDIDGYTVCQRIREFSLIPIIMVTAKGKDEEKVTGLDAGADDYVTKPFAAKELNARVRAVLRRSQSWGEKAEPVFRLENLVVDFALRKVTLGRQEIDLTATEYKIISYLARNAGRVVTPDSILYHVWGEEYEGESHLLQVNVARLRRKIGDSAKNPKYVRTRPGIGYIMTKPV